MISGFFANKIILNGVLCACESVFVWVCAYLLFYSCSELGSSEKKIYRRERIKKLCESLLLCFCYLTDCIAHIRSSTRKRISKKKKTHDEKKECGHFALKRNRSKRISHFLGRSAIRRNRAEKEAEEGKAAAAAAEKRIDNRRYV